MMIEARTFVVCRHERRSGETIIALTFWPALHRPRMSISTVSLTMQTR